MNTQKMAGLVLAMGLSGSAQAALQGRDLNGSAGSFEAFYDTVLDITWLADANYAQTSGYDADGKMTWFAANTWAANLSFYNPLTNQTYADWRLPTVEPVNGVSFNYSTSFDGSTDVGYNITSPQSEMAHLYYVTLGNPGAYTPSGANSGCTVVNTSNTCLDNVGPFSRLQDYGYWSGTEYALYTSNAWGFVFYDGRQVGGGGSGSLYALAVSSGDVAITGVPAAIPEPEAWGLMLSGLGLVGWAARRQRTTLQSREAA